MSETPHRIVVSPDLAPPVGYAQAIVAAPGRTVYLGGQTALNKENEIVGETVVEQFEVAAGNVMTALRAAGGEPQHIVSMQIFVRDVEDYKANLRELAGAWKRNFGTHYPAAGLFGVTRLFDDPALIEDDLLARHVAALKRGETIERPLYDFAHHIRVPDKTETVHPPKLLIVEGLFALYYPELLPLYQLRIYMETPDELCFERRLRRDTQERGRSEAGVRAQYEATVRPSGLLYVRPSARNADLILDGGEALDWKLEQSLSMMRKQGLLTLGA